MRNPIARFKAILGELLQHGRTSADRTADLQARVNDLHIILKQNIDQLKQNIDQLTASVGRLDGDIDALRSGMGQVHHALLSRSWPDLFDPFATTAIACRIQTLGKLLMPVAAEGHRKIRVGNQFDGGYVMVDDWAGILGAVSIGIGDNDVWDREILDRGIPVAQYDHTIDRPVTMSRGMTWHRVGIGATDTGELRTLRSIIHLAGFPEVGDLILKLDAEAAEWDALETDDAAPLERFRQLVVEFHWFDRIIDDAWFATAERTIARISRSHAPIHVHANNGVGMALLGGVCFPRVLEVTFARRDAYTMRECQETFPTALDAPCHSGRPDHFLGAFRFSKPPVTHIRS